MISMNLATDRTPGEDCFTLALGNILKHKGFSKYLTIWKQCGLSYLKKSNEDFGSISPKYLSIKEELKLIHNIELQDNSSADFNIICNDILFHLKNGEPVIAYIDVHNFSSHSSFKKRHLMHCITLINYCNNNFTFLDDHHRIHDTIDQNSLKNAMNLNWFYESETYNISSVDCRYALQEITETNLIRTIRNNLNILNGSHIDNHYKEVLPNDSKCYFGINSVNYLIEDCNNYLLNNEFISTEVIDILYDGLSGVANSRYLYCEFLKEGVKFYAELSSFIDKYIECAQYWKVASNMLLKSKNLEAYERTSIFMRMVNKLNEVFQLEKEALSLSESFITNLYTVSKE